MILSISEPCFAYKKEYKYKQQYYLYWSSTEGKKNKTDTYDFISWFQKVSSLYHVTTARVDQKTLRFQLLNWR